MIVVTPLYIDTANLVSSNVTNVEATWAAGTYTLGTRKVYGELVYEVVADPSTADQPDTGAALTVPTWIVVGSPNKWRMFRDGTDSYSEKAVEIAAVISILGAVDTVALLGLYGYNATVEVYTADAVLAYSETILLPDIGVDDWWEFFSLPYNRVSIAYFGNLPIYPGGEIRVTITATTTGENARCGRVIAGLAEDLGVTLQDYRASIEDFSIRERDGFGNLTLTPRRTIQISDYNIMIESLNSHQVLSRFSDLRATPVLFVGDPDLLETINFAVYNRMTVLRAGIDASEYSLTTEGF